ncbi:hypothetical protein KFK09_014208 [Dendrobium nobile]|uniref:Retrovirus-related Pol polyprotein from transposon TNT 1-94 n=1 Tax=Dendrobium nobile TaxID=94219 RepID=A0A8T3BB17_DENNO|nr:hypothetical protein KFK09_014208 [Dendrobium nobile]
MQLKEHRAVFLSLGDEVVRKVAEEESAIGIWQKLESFYLKKVSCNPVILEKLIIHSTNGGFKGPQKAYE